MIVERAETMSLRGAFAQFQAAHPEFDAAGAEELRAREFGRLDREDHIYLDYTGGGLHAESQVREHATLLGRTVFGNPHSASPTSVAATESAERARAAILAFFNASPREYTVVFTSNASGALKLVGESYPFGPGSRYVLTADNHNSVNGIREFARASGATVRYVPVRPPDLRADSRAVRSTLVRLKPGMHGLFAFPAQSNFSGVQHPLEWIGQARARGWDVFVDAAAFAPTNRLDLGRWHPGFVSLSFYKMFGYPTGVGCLIARRDALHKLRRPWFSGGTVSVASVQGDAHVLAEGEAGFEDGTINYLSLPAVEIGLRHLAAVGVETVHARVSALTDWLTANLTALRHRNGTPLVRLYGPVGAERRGGTIAFNLYDPDGRLHDCDRVQKRASNRRISLRTGCFCNPGASECAFELTRDEIEPILRRGGRPTANDLRALLRPKAVGAIRASVGIATTFADIYRFVNFLQLFLDEAAE